MAKSKSEEIGEWGEKKNSAGKFPTPLLFFDS